MRREDLGINGRCLVAPVKDKPYEPTVPFCEAKAEAEPV